MNTKIFNKAISFALLTITILLTSCSKELDSADAYVGVYSVSVIRDIIIGQSSTTQTDSGVLNIEKIGPNKINLSYYINTTGTIVNNKLYLNPIRFEEGEEYINIIFEETEFNNPILKISSIESGRLINKDNHQAFSFTTYNSMTCIKQ